MDRIGRIGLGPTHHNGNTYEYHRGPSYLEFQPLGVALPGPPAVFPFFRVFFFIFFYFAFLLCSAPGRSFS